jgi:hypothetical protein
MRKKDIASSFAMKIAEAMIGIPEKMVRKVMTERHGDDKQFVTFTPLFPDYSAFKDEERSKMHTDWRRDVYSEFSEEISTGKELVKAQISYKNFISLIGFPKDIIESFPEKKVAPENNRRIVAKTAIALLEEPEK